MKKILSIFIIGLMVFSSLSVFAADVSYEEYAYMDLSKATASEKVMIEAARNKIIFSQSWGLEGGYIVRANGDIETVPKFYDIFPSDWEIPSGNATMLATTSEVTPMTESWNLQVYFDAPPASGISPSVGNFYHDGGYIQVGVVSLTSSQHCNLGVTNNSTGASLGYAERLYPGEAYYCPTLTLNPFYAGVRYSTYSNPGYGVINVLHDESQIVK